MTRSLQFWISGVNNDPCINILDKVESIITQSSIALTELEDCMHEYLRLLMSGVFNDNKFTILNVWSKQWYQYQHSWRSEVTHILKSRILNECSRQWSQHPDSLRNSIIFTELEDYRHEYLRLWMSDAFNDQKFTILNAWSQRCSQHPDSLRNSIILTELVDYRHEYLRLSMNGVFHDQKLQVWISGVNNDTSINILDGVKSLIS